MPRARYVVSPLVALVATLLLGVPAFAQEASPAFPITADPADCPAEVAPRSLDEIVAFAAAATPVAEVPTTVAVPLGEAADAATTEALVAVVRAELGCVAAGDFLRNAAFYTDDALRRVFAIETIPEAELRALFGAPSAPLPAEFRTSILAVTDAMILPDGRAGAFFVFADPGAPPVTEFLLFSRDGDRDQWLVDDDLTFAPEAMMDDATAAA